MLVTITADLLRSACPNIPLKTAELFAPILQASMSKYGVTAYPMRSAAYLANAVHESAGFTRLKESFRYRDPVRLYAIFKRDFKNLDDATAVWRKGPEAIANRVYANQNGNGNEASGDGLKYCGRGIGQVTGRANYKAVGQRIGQDLINHPELLEQPVHAVESFSVFWHDRQLNTVADNADFNRICRIINGGENGLVERQSLYKAFLKILGSSRFV